MGRKSRVKVLNCPREESEEFCEFRGSVLRHITSRGWSGSRVWATPSSIRERLRFDDIPSERDGWNAICAGVDKDWLGEMR